MTGAVAGGEGESGAAAFKRVSRSRAFHSGGRRKYSCTRARMYMCAREIECALFHVMCEHAFLSRSAREKSVSAACGRAV